MILEVTTNTQQTTNSQATKKFRNNAISFFQTKLRCFVVTETYSANRWFLESVSKVIIVDPNCRQEDFNRGFTFMQRA